MVDNQVKFEGIRKYESWFQLAFTDGEVWELQDKIFTMWENKEVKGQRQKKSNVVKKIEQTIEEVADDMKLSHWQAMQGIKDEQLLVLILSRIVAKELSLEEIVTKFNK